MELKIDRENLAFLGGFLNALSLVAGDLHETTMTAIIINELEPLSPATLIKFYELDWQIRDFIKSKIEFYGIEKVFESHLLDSPLNAILKDSIKIAYLSYKFMDYLCFCIASYHDNLIDFKALTWQDLQVNLPHQNARFLALPIADNQTLLITFWQKLD